MSRDGRTPEVEEVVNLFQDLKAANKAAAGMLEPEFSRCNNCGKTWARPMPDDDMCPNCSIKVQIVQRSPMEAPAITESVDPDIESLESRQSSVFFGHQDKHGVATIEYLRKATENPLCALALVHLAQATARAEYL